MKQDEGGVPSCGGDAGDAVPLWQAGETSRALLESAPDAVVIVNQQGTIVLVNSQTEKIFGYRREQLLGRSVEVLLPERLRQAHLDHRTKYSREPTVRPIGVFTELTARRQDGSEFPAEISLSPLHTESGVLITSVIRDSTERQQTLEALRRAHDQLEARVAERTAELSKANETLHEQHEALLRQREELARYNAELEQFAYVAAHDLQEPLRTVASFTQLLAIRYKGKLDGDADKFIDFAVKGAARMRRLIDDLLAYSRLVRREINPQATDCEVMFQQSIENLRATLEESAAIVTHETLPTIRADPLQLGQVFQNLLGNAVKFRGPRSPRVHVAAQRQGDEWLFSVRDNGIGIDPEYTERVFRIFERLHGKHEYPGSGIGLALCKRIVEGHRGRIWVESQPGEGATFRFTIPAK